MFETGLLNLDLMLGGGILEGDTLLVVGPAGAGETKACLQLGRERKASDLKEREAQANTKGAEGGSARRTDGERQ